MTSRAIMLRLHSPSQFLTLTRWTCFEPMRVIKHLTIAVALLLTGPVASFAAAPGEAVLSLDLSRPGPAISPYLYGQFIEHLGRCIHDGIWAEKLWDRKFLLALDKSPWQAVGAGRQRVSRCGGRVCRGALPGAVAARRRGRGVRDSAEGHRADRREGVCRLRGCRGCQRRAGAGGGAVVGRGRRRTTERHADRARAGLPPDCLPVQGWRAQRTRLRFRCGWSSPAWCGSGACR